MRHDSLNIHLPWLEKRPNETRSEHRVRTRQKGQLGALDALNDGSFPVDDRLSVFITFVCPDGKIRKPDALFADAIPSIEGALQAIGAPKATIDRYDIEFARDMRGLGFVKISLRSQ